MSATTKTKAIGILRTTYWLHRDPVSRPAYGGDGAYVRFASIEDAQAWIAEADARPYYESYGECGRPNYEAVAVTDERYVKAVEDDE